MFLHVIVGFALIVIPASVHAQDCSADTMAEGRGLQDRLDDLDRTLTRLTARGDGQDLRIADLLEGFGDEIPERPQAPMLPTEGFDEDGAVTWTCDADGSAGETPTLIAQALDEAAVALQTYEAALDKREAALALAEEAAEGAESDQAAIEPEGDERATVEPDEAEPDDAEAPEGDTAEAEPTAPSIVEGDAAVQEPLPDPSNPNVYRRVIALPDASLRDEPSGEGDEGGDAVPTFALFYVFEEREVAGETWVEVGASLRSGATGWARLDETLPWSTMLVMQFAPRGQRERVIFFEDSTDLSLLVDSPFYREEASEMYEALDAERSRLAEDPSYEPQWDGKLVAVEPETAVTYDDQPYLLPILDWEETSFDGTVDTVLLKVAAIPADAEAIGDTDEATFSVSAAEAARQDDEYRTGIVFVIDTSVSMSPFIERTRDAVEGFYQEFAGLESSAFVSFGLIGFRDDLARDPESLEYVTRVFQPLDPEAPQEQVLANLSQVEEATVSNVDFREDAFAGVVAAIEEMDWEPFDARIVILITDASAREGDDPLATHPGLSAQAVTEAARASNISLVPVHLRSDAAERLEDAARAEAQYKTLSETGDLTDNYIVLDPEDPDAMGRALEALAGKLARNLAKANSGELIGSEADGVELEPVPSDGYSPEGQLATVVTNEMFRAQLESLAAVGGGDAPAFLAGWASDRDLTDPDRDTLEVSVFLTRDQLSSLDRQLDVIVEAFRSGGDDPEAFFDRLQELAADISTDPDAVKGDDRLAIQTILPAFLANLPYRSEVLGINQDYWASLSVSGRQEFIERIEQKQVIYQDIFDQTDLWNDFGAGDPGLEATPVRLSNLP